MIKSPTCYKNIENPKCIDLILTNSAYNFQHSKVIETGLSDFHKMVITVMKNTYPKQTPNIIKYRDYKNFINASFYHDVITKVIPIEPLGKTLCKIKPILEKHAPKKSRYIRANQAPYMNKNLHKEVMKRSRLKNKYLKDKTFENWNAYKKQRNICVYSFRKEKKKYFSNININNVTDNKKFWKTVKPAFSEKSLTTNKITLIEKDDITSTDEAVAHKFNSYFSNVVKNLNIPRDSVELVRVEHVEDPLMNSILKYGKHPSILAIKEFIKDPNVFDFQIVSIEDIENEILSLDLKKTCQENDIPTKLLKNNSGIFSHIIFHDFNQCIVNSIFPDELKVADVIPVFKKGDKTSTTNYRPVSILPNISKIYERCLFKQMNLYFEKKLSKYQCGFRKGVSVQHCLLLMIEKWKKCMDNKNAFGALLTDLSKAFDCLVHDLLIAKLNAYGFSYRALKLVYNYLTNRKQRVKINCTFSNWNDILLGVPQGSILGPLLFNIYMCDMFFCIGSIDIVGYADDNTPYIVDSDCNSVIKNIQGTIEKMATWFSTNYMLLNNDKCHLFLTGQNSSFYNVTLGKELLLPTESEKLLGIYIDKSLTFEEHLSNLCDKASQKLHALSRIAYFLDSNQKRTLMKAFITSQFNYCPLIWMIHSRKIEHRINRIHERALRIVYNDNEASFQELLDYDCSVTIHQKNLQCLAIEMYKVIKGIAPQIMNEVFEVRKPISYKLRNCSEFKRSNVKTVKYGEKSLSYLAPKVWDLIPAEIKNLDSLNQFKNSIRTWKTESCPCKLCAIYINQVGFL